MDQLIAPLYLAQLDLSQSENIAIYPKDLAIISQLGFLMGAR